MLTKVKKAAQARIAEATLTGKIVQIPQDVVMFSCPNHFQSHNGKQIKVKYPLHFIKNEKERTCECGTIYKRIN